MFIFIQKLTATIIFGFHQIDKLAMQDQVLKRLKSKVQYRCHPDFGYVVQVVSMSQKKFNTSSIPSVQDQHCEIIIQFSAICFKPLKNDILEIVVSQVCQDFIKGKVGSVEILIPASKMTDQLYFQKEQNIFIIKINKHRIQTGSKIRCQCLQIKTQMGCQMKIIALLPKKLLSNVPS